MVLTTKASLSKEESRLLEAAGRALGHAYAPYTRFREGAAVLIDGGKIITGASFEPLSYHPITAVQSAISTANAYGHRTFKTIAITAQNDRPVSMSDKASFDFALCGRLLSGASRQVLVEAEELSGNDLKIIRSMGKEDLSIEPSAEALLPDALRPKDLGVDIGSYRRGAQTKTAPFTDTFLDVNAALSELQEKLLDAASFAMENAYSPYSRFKVGESALRADGRITIGANFENASGESVHGEQSLIAAVNSLGDKMPSTIAIITRGETFNSEDITGPCGNCSQVLLEVEHLSGKPLKIIEANTNRSKTVVFNSARELVPHAPNPAQIGADITKYRRTN